jgi:hypothetical protein
MYNNLIIRATALHLHFLHSNDVYVENQEICFSYANGHQSYCPDVHTLSHKFPSVMSGLY